MSGGEGVNFLQAPTSFPQAPSYSLGPQEPNMAIKLNIIQPTGKSDSTLGGGDSHQHVVHVAFLALSGLRYVRPPRLEVRSYTPLLSKPPQA